MFYLSGFFNLSIDNIFSQTTLLYPSWTFFLKEINATSNQFRLNRDKFTLSVSEFIYRSPSIFKFSDNGRSNSFAFNISKPISVFIWHITFPYKFNVSLLYIQRLTKNRIKSIILIIFRVVIYVKCYRLNIVQVLHAIA